MKKLLIASNNAGKIAEFKALFSTIGVDVISLKEAGIDSDPAETGLTFVENALLKARNAAKLSGLPTLADDSGLVVMALNGEPGIYSARYSEAATDDANNQKLLKKMAHLQGEARAAYFKAVLVILRNENDPVPIIAEGEVHGLITHEISGGGGFGYDPLFYYPDANKTFGELTPEEKNSISHRAIALSQLKNRLITI